MPSMDQLQGNISVFSRAEYESLVLDQTQLDPALANMKSDDLEYPGTATPEPRGWCLIRDMLR